MLCSVLLAAAVSIQLGGVPHTELPSTFDADRAFVMPRVGRSLRRLALWVDTDGSGFLRSGVVTSLKLQTTPSREAYLPPLDERDFPAPTANRGALPVLDDAQIAADPVFSGVDGQLGWTWLADRIWTFDYVGHHIYQDYSAPSIPGGERVPLNFDAKHRYPQVAIVIDGKTYRAALDTAATVALSQQAVQELGDGLPAVRATSFIPHRTLDAWHAAHPDWKYIAAAGKGVSLIRVPVVRAAPVTFRDVWFSTRPDDDVFADGMVDAKLGPTAFGACVVTIDYVHADAGFSCEGS